MATEKQTEAPRALELDDLDKAVGGLRESFPEEVTKTDSEQNLKPTR